MERYARFIVAHPRLVVAAVCLVTVLAILQLPKIHLEIRRRAQLPQDHPYVQVQNEIADRFGGETTIIIGVLPRRDDVFAPEILQKIQRISHRLEQQRGVVPGSLLSITAERVKAIRATADGIDVRPFVDEVPTSSAAIDKLRSEFLHDPIFSGTLAAPDGRATAIVVDFDDSLTDVEIHNLIESVLRDERTQDVDLVVGGAPLVRAYMTDYIRQMDYLFLAAVVIIGMVHYEAFRTVQAMLLPLVTALVSVVWSLGTLAYWGEPLDTWSALSPVVILAVAAGHAVQILKRYYEEFDRTGSNNEAVVRSLVAVGPVTITAGCVASAGFGSLVTFGVASVRVFGFTLALGILSALVVEMTFIPACRVLLPAPRGRETMTGGGGRALRWMLERIATSTTTYPRMVLGLSAVLVAVFLVGATQVRVDNSFHGWFPRDSRLRLDDDELNSRLAGTSTLYVLVQGDKEGAIADPQVIRALGDLEKWLRNQPNIGATLSVYDHIAHMHSVMTGETIIPDNRALIEQYLFLYSMSGPDQLSSFVDSNERNAVLRAYAKSDEAEFGDKLLVGLQSFATSRFAGLPVKVRVGGGALGVQTALNEMVVREKLVNILQVGGIILLLSGLALRSLAGGLLVVTPLVVAIAVCFGVMGFTGTWLSVGTSTVSAMAISIGADFAIYLIYRIREELQTGTVLDDALKKSLQTAGGAICFVASAVVLGYLVLALSGFRLWVHLGVLTALMMIVGAVATLMIIPSIVIVVRPRFLVGQRAVSSPEAAKPGALSAR
jgi:predicted RND superfamily exporter protein